MDQEVIDNISTERILRHIQRLEGVRNPRTNPEALERAADYIFNELTSLDYQVATPVFKEGDREFRNIVATRIGKGNPDERVIILAHYDTVETSPGADDNASGVAVLLELARILEPLEFSQTVQYVAVNLEELQREGPMETAGLFGSRALAIQAEQQKWNIKGVIVLETIAYAGEQISQKILPGLLAVLPEAVNFLGESRNEASASIAGNFLNVIGNTASAGLVEMFSQAIREHQIPFPMVPLLVPGNGEILPDTRRSDHSSFWDRGYQAVMLTDTANFRNPNYHQTSDTLETLNPTFVTQVCRTVAWVVVEAAR